MSFLWSIYDQGDLLLCVLCLKLTTVDLIAWIVIKFSLLWVNQSFTGFASTFIVGVAWECWGHILDYKVTKAPWSHSKIILHVNASCILCKVDSFGVMEDLEFLVFRPLNMSYWWDIFHYKFWIWFAPKGEFFVLFST